MTIHRRLTASTVVQRQKLSRNFAMSVGYLFTVARHPRYHFRLQVPVPPVLGRAGPRCFPGAAGDRGWRQGAPGGCANRWPSVSSRCGGSVSSAPTTVPRRRRSSMSWRIGTNPRPAVWRKATLHRLGVYGVLGRSLKTTNGALIEERCAKVDHWQNSSQRHRWLATALLDIDHACAR